MPELQQMLGRLYAVDPRDELHPMIRAVAQLAAGPTPDRRAWPANSWWGDQSATPPSFDGDHPYCVGFASAHYLADAPLCEPHAKGLPPMDPLAIYAGAQALDEFPGPPPPYDGTSGRGAMKWLAAQGFIAAYHWAQSLEEVAETILRLGPVLMGTPWDNAMFTPDAQGLIRRGGGVAGGHETKWDGFDSQKKLFRIKNSWGRSWGHKGFCFIGWDDALSLWKDGGDGVIGTKQLLQPKP